MMADEGFLARWSRKKAGVPAADPEPASTGPAQAKAAPEDPVAAPPAPPPPTLEDVAQLTRESDFSRFVAPDVDDSVKQAAMKKLFSDPHFNVMDGLDTYIDDYGKPDPIPESMLRRMAQSAALGLFADDEEKPHDSKASPDGEAAVAVPKSSIDTSAVPLDEDPDLRLQQDDAAGPGGAGEGPRA
jgi:hypothetical protein